MIKLLFSASIVLFIQGILTQRPTSRYPEPSPENPRSTFNPVSKVLSDLSEFILDVDEAVARQIATNANFEDDVNENVRRRSSRTSYFDRIRENYRNIQDRIGLSQGVPDELSVTSDLFDVNVKDKGQVIDVTVPLSPIKVVARTNNPFLKTAFDSEDLYKVGNDGSSSIIYKQTPPVDSSFREKTKKENAEINKRLNNAYPDAFIKDEQIQLQQRSARLQKLSDISSINEESEEFIPTGAIVELSTSSFDADELISTQSAEFDETTLKDQETSGLRGRILGDVLYSESVFDKILKRLMTDYGSFILDSDLSPSKIFNRLSKATRNIFRSGETSTSGESEKVTEDKIQTTSNNLPASNEIQTDEFQQNIHRPKQSPAPIWNNVLEKEKAEKPEFSDDLKPAENSWKFGSTKTNVKRTGRKQILLAFTQEGIPLKLKVPADLENPLGFLHRILKTAEVSLNFPVESLKNIEPSGTAVLQLGTGKGGINSRTLNVDLTDSDQLDSFLRILRNFKTDAN